MSKASKPSKVNGESSAFHSHFGKFIFQEIDLLYRSWVNAVQHCKIKTYPITEIEKRKHSWQHTLPFAVHFGDAVRKILDNFFSDVHPKLDAGIIFVITQYHDVNLFHRILQHFPSNNLVVVQFRKHV